VVARLGVNEAHILSSMQEDVAICSANRRLERIQLVPSSAQSVSSD
jgi:hypothetical protein